MGVELGAGGGEGENGAGFDGEGEGEAVGGVAREEHVAVETEGVEEEAGFGKRPQARVP